MLTDILLEYVDQSRSLVVAWKLPQFIPYSYKLLMSCYFLYIQYRKPKFTLPSTTTHIEIDGILENSRCEVNLAAEYNPASIDPGLDMSILITTPPKSKYTLCAKCTCIDEC